MVRSSRQGLIPDDYAALIDRIDDFADRIKTLEAPSGEAAGNVLPRTLANIADLIGRVSAFVSGVDIESWTVGGGSVVDHPFGPIVPFTLDRPRLVRIRITAHSHVSATRPALSASRLEVDAVLNPIIDGAPAAVGTVFQDGYDEEFMRLPPGTEEAELQSYRRLVAEIYVPLAAGDHSAAGWINASFYDPAAATCDGGITFTNPSVAVDILQPVTM